MINVKHNGQRALSFKFSNNRLSFVIRPRAYIGGLGYVTVKYNIPVYIKR